MSAIDSAQFDARLEQFLAALQAKNSAEYKESFPTLAPPVFAAMPGSRYVRIVRRDASGGGGSAYAFIDRTNGDILKPASYKAPAKHARGNIFADDFGVSCCQIHSVNYLR